MIKIFEVPNLAHPLLQPQLIYWNLFRRNLNTSTYPNSKIDQTTYSITFYRFAWISNHDNCHVSSFAMFCIIVSSWSQTRSYRFRIPQFSFICHNSMFSTSCYYQVQVSEVYSVEKKVVQIQNLSWLRTCPFVWWLA